VRLRSLSRSGERKEKKTQEDKNKKKKLSPSPKALGCGTDKQKKDRKHDELEPMTHARDLKNAAPTRLNEEARHFFRRRHRDHGMTRTNRAARWAFELLHNTVSFESETRRRWTRKARRWFEV
jgi:hypothetical protein